MGHRMLPPVLLLLTMVVHSQGFTVLHSSTRSLASFTRRASKPRLTRTAAGRSVSSRSTSRLHVSTTPSPSSIDALPKSLRGGDFAGLVATFDAVTGKLIPLPDYMVPQSLLEWGVPPSTLEILVTEDGVSKRQICTVFPSTGCDVDNLETALSEEKFDVVGSSAEDYWYTHSFSHHKPTGDTMVQIETCWGWTAPNVDGVPPVDDALYRSRVHIKLALSNNTASSATIKLISPVRIYLERQVTDTDNVYDTRGIAQRFNRGGLDGRTLSQWLGPVLSKKALQTFAERDTSSATWHADPIDARSHVVSLDPTHRPYMLPGNFTVAAQNKGATVILDVGHIHHSTRPVRQIVRHTFQRNGTVGLWQEVATVQSWLETGTLQSD